LEDLPLHILDTGENAITDAGVLSFLKEAVNNGLKNLLKE